MVRAGAPAAIRAMRCAVEGVFIRSISPFAGLGPHRCAHRMRDPPFTSRWHGAVDSGRSRGGARLPSRPRAGCGPDRSTGSGGIPAGQLTGGPSQGGYPPAIQRKTPAAGSPHLPRECVEQWPRMGANDLFGASTENGPNATPTSADPPRDHHSTAGLEHRRCSSGKDQHGRESHGTSPIPNARPGHLRGGSTIS
jgi:hypothetical protein